MDKKDIFSDENFQEIKNCLSAERLFAYEKIIAPAPEGLAIFIYQVMQMHSSLLFVPIQYLEVCLRNRTYNALKNFYDARKKVIAPLGTPGEWYKWMPQKQITKDNISEACKKAKNQIRNRRPIVYGDIISRLTLGVWVSILEERTDNKDPLFFWSGVVRDIFPNTTYKKGKIMQTLNDIATIRNRLFHHEPLWKSEKSKTVSYDIDDILLKMNNTYTTIVEVIGWMSTGLQQHILGCLHKVLFDSTADELKKTVAMYRFIGEKNTP